LAIALLSSAFDLTTTCWISRKLNFVRFRLDCRPFAEIRLYCSLDMRPPVAGVLKGQRSLAEPIVSSHRLFHSAPSVYCDRSKPQTNIRYFTSSSKLASSKPANYGQPLSSSHPERIKPHELTRGIKPEEYESRRKKLMEGLPEGSVVVCMGGTVRLMTQG